jgi:hypothetical protein
MYSGNVRYGVPAILYIRYNGSWGNENSFFGKFCYKIITRLLQKCYKNIKFVSSSRFAKYVIIKNYNNYDKEKSCCGLISGSDN